MQTLVVTTLVLLLSACGSSNPAGSPAGAGTIAADYPGVTNTVPVSPAPGTSRPGTFYNVYIQGPVTGDKIAFTVFEPATFTGGQKYPLVLHSHGFSASRQTSTPSNPATGTLSPGSVDQLVAANYGVISIDERGHGESGGTIRVMDPDFEGQDLLAVIDWAEAKLDWLAYGPSADGKDPHNLILGSIGGSYGGMYQYLIHNIDPKHRLDAMVPQISPNDLTYSLFPNSVIKADWDFFLFGAGNTAGNQGGSVGHFDPFVTQFFETALPANQVNQYGHDFFYYHSNAYFCDGLPVATNGGPGTSPKYPPVRPNDKVNVLFFQGMRDTLFNYSEGYANYQCLKAQGGDVRLLSYQSGHNTLQVVPDPGEALYQPPGDDLQSNCGHLNVNDATLAFFNQYLKGMPDAASKLPKQVCLSLSGSDAVLVDQVMTQVSGLEKMAPVPATNVVAGVADAPMQVDLGITSGANGDVIGGIPHLTVNITDPTGALATASGGDPIIFFGIGQIRVADPNTVVLPDLVDNQVTPVRGLGMHDLDMTGVSQRLTAGDKLVLLIYGLEDQYSATGSVNIAHPVVAPLSVSGKVWVPMLGPLPSAP
ncbi:MAG: alpha/beta hydrolase family protein [Stenotrophobium sp.]